MAFSDCDTCWCLSLHGSQFLCGGRSVSSVSIIFEWESVCLCESVWIQVMTVLAGSTLVGIDGMKINLYGDFPTNIQHG